MRIKIKQAVICHDLFMIALSWQLAWLSRFNFSISLSDWKNSLISLPFVLLIQAGVLWYLRLYKGVWRFASLNDLWNIFRAAMIGTLLIVITLFITYRLVGIPRSVAVLYPLYLIFLLGAPRLGYRFWKDNGFSFNRLSNGPKVLVLGAGRGGDQVIRDMLRTGFYTPVAVLDDDPALKKAEIHGIKILGAIDKLKEVISQYTIDYIFIAIPSASNEQMQKIYSYCDDITIPVKTLPKLEEMTTDNNALNTLREVSIEDLLGREKIELDWATLQNGIVSKTILITGAGGSIGSELCEQIAQLGPRRIIFYEQSEFALYKLQQTFDEDYPKVSYEGVLGDVCDKEKLEHIFSLHKPDSVFHAAAYKHVPILENQVREAVKNNVLGTQYLVDTAAKHNIEKFVFISTDKAVKPANVLGKSKRLAEYYCEHKSINKVTKFITVRFGNVLGSDGSVVPLFKKQIEDGGPVTVTHPEVTRFFMTIPEACQLILQAAAMGNGGEIFVLDMGKTVKISYLAEKMIQLSGKTPGKDIEIEYTGLRPGEKLYEELFYSDEERVETDHEKIYQARQASLDGNNIDIFFQELETLCASFDEEELLKRIDRIVPSADSDAIADNNNVIAIKKR